MHVAVLHLVARAAVLHIRPAAHRVTVVEAAAIAVVDAGNWNL